ncbi:MAG: hypothetical protein R3C10_19520 [Pirellulales bacterium]|nr:hypothetical protein [Planctomycetales bacterium]
MSSTSLLDRVFTPIGRSMTPEVAAEIVALRADDATQQRVDELAEKCNEGTLTEAERDEYAQYVATFNIITILQARARSVIDAANGQ